MESAPAEVADWAALPDNKDVSNNCFCFSWLYAAFQLTETIVFQWAAEAPAGGAGTGGFGAPTSTDWGADSSDWAASTTTGDASADWGAPAGGENWS